MRRPGEVPGPRARRARTLAAWPGRMRRRTRRRSVRSDRATAGPSPRARAVLALAHGRRAALGCRPHRRHLARHLLDRRVAAGRRHPRLPRPGAVLEPPPFGGDGHGAREPQSGGPPGGPGPHGRHRRRRRRPGRRSERSPPGRREDARGRMGGRHHDPPKSPGVGSRASLARRRWWTMSTLLMALHDGGRKPTDGREARLRHASRMFISSRGGFDWTPATVQRYLLVRTATHRRANEVVRIACATVFQCHRILPSSHQPASAATRLP